MDDTAEVDALFQLPLGEFIAGRNRTAARLRAAGATEEASRVKALAKPSAAAWAVNQVYWTERPAFDALIEAGANLRAAQREGGAPDGIREAMRRRRDALAAAVKRAEAALGAGGHGAPTATVLRIASTLEALASGEEPGPQAGRLTVDLDPPGFEALAGLVLANPSPRSPRLAPVPPPPPSPSPAAVPADDEAARSRAAVAKAEEELGTCRAAEERASAERESAVRRAETAAQSRDSARREAERAEFAAREARAAAELAQREADAATAARVRAEAALDAARSAAAGSGSR